jgi:hypothetical protein
MANTPESSFHAPVRLRHGLPSRGPAGQPRRTEQIAGVFYLTSPACALIGIKSAGLRIKAWHLFGDAKVAI